jgi:tRNA A-37 threonylcarbamoyl transferase component Bud32
MTVDVRAVDAAMEAVLVNFDRLLQLVEDGGLQQLDDVQFTAFLQGYERVRNRLRFVERQAQLAAARASAARRASA